MWIDIGLTITLVTTVVLWVLWGVYYSTPKRKRLARTKPVVRVCKEHGRVGVVLRKDYDAASKAEWQPYIDGTKQHDPGHVAAPDGTRLQPATMFIFKSGSPEYYTLVYHCFVERAEFYVPIIRKEDMDNIASAWQYIFGKPFTGRLINW